MLKGRGGAWGQALLALGLGTTMLVSSGLPAMAAQTTASAKTTGVKSKHTTSGLGFGLPTPPAGLLDSTHAAPLTLPVNGYDISGLASTSVDTSVLPVGVLTQRNFAATLTQWEQQGAKPVPSNVSVTIPATSYYKTSSGSPGLKTIPPGQLDGNTQTVLGWPTSVQDVFYHFSAPQTGLYELRVHYYDYPGCFSADSRSEASFVTNTTTNINQAWCGKDTSSERGFQIDPPGTVPVVQQGSGISRTPAAILDAAKKAGLSPSSLPAWINQNELAPPTTSAPAWAIASAKSPKSAACAVNLAGPSGPMNYNGYQYQEANQSPFPEEWTETGQHVLPNGLVDFQKDNEGDDLYPIPKEVEGWQSLNVSDAQGEYQTPLLFCLTKGPHVLGVQEIQGPMAIASFTFHGATVLPSYQQALKTWEAQGMKPVHCGMCVQVQGDNIYRTSDPTIRPGSSSNPGVTPPANGYYILNMLQGEEWQYPAQWVEWKFTVPQTGLYKIGFKVLQAAQGGGLVGTPVTRSLEIDGKLPFQGAQWISFPFNNNWQMSTLSQPNGQPALIGLTKGTHTLRLETSLGLLGDSMATIQRASQFLGELYQQILLITGPSPDANVTYDLASSLPFLVPDMRAVIRVLDQQAAYLTYSAGGVVPDAADTVEIAAQDLQRLAAHPNNIPLSLSEWSSDTASLAGVLTQMQDQALSINWFAISAPSFSYPAPGASILSGLSNTWRTFILSFYRNYTDVGSVYNHAITVWVGWGQTWAKVMSQMTQNSFTPATGIHVNFNVVPGGTGIVLLAEASGKGPDVATGMATTDPVNFAIRDGAYDLTKFPHWSTIAQRFVPAALTQYAFTNANGLTGIYGLPETQGMMLMVYRTDILKALGLKVPQTWPEVYKMMPILEAHGMQFYYPAGPAGILPFLYQNGGQYYENTANGIRSAIGSEGGYLGFKAWTDLFDEWKVPLAANFFTEMETGQMPIGITDYPTFVTIDVAAPQLAGLWALAPIPSTPYLCTAAGKCAIVSTGPCAFGNPNHPLTFKNGSYCKYNGTSGDLEESTSIIMPSNGTHPLQSWKWVEWWTSAPVQLQFAQQIQAIGGPSLAWNTANNLALPGLQWPSADIQVMEQARADYVPEPMVPGGYISDRYINDIWTNVVVNGENARQQLLWGVQNINDELYRQEVSFGLAKIIAGRNPLAGA